MRASSSALFLATVIAAGLLTAGCGGGPEQKETLTPGTSAPAPSASASVSADPAESTAPSPTEGRPEPSGSTPVAEDETAKVFASRAFDIFDAAGRAKSCAQTKQFYRDFLLPDLSAVLVNAPGACNDASLDTRFTYRVTGVSEFDPKNFYTEPVPEQALAPLASAEEVVRVDLAGTKAQDFANYWLVARENGRFYLFHPVLFQISICFDENFVPLPDAPSWCAAHSAR